MRCFAHTNKQTNKHETFITTHTTGLFRLRDLQCHRGLRGGLYRRLDLRLPFLSHFSDPENAHILSDGPGPRKGADPDAKGNTSHVLVHEDHIAIRVRKHDARRSGGVLIGFAGQLGSFLFEADLNGPYIIEAL